MNETLLAKLKEASELEPDKHDGSYELMRETIRAYANIVDNTELDFNDLNTVYLMSVGTWKHGIEAKKKLILNDSHLKDNDKQHLVTVIDKIAENAKNDIYSNKELDTDGKFGMFGTGFYTFKNKTDSKSVNGFIKLCTEIIDMDDENAIFDKAQLVLDKNYHGMKAASASMVLHCLKPYVFPILNSNMGSDDIFKALDIKLTRKGDIDTYIENCRRIKAFRDKNLPFKNYRILDMEAWNLEGDKHPNMQIDIEAIEKYLQVYSGEQYKNPDKAGEASDRMKKMSEEGKNARKQFIELSNLVIATFDKYVPGKCTDWVNQGQKVPDYLWVEFKKKGFEESNSSISLAALKEENEVVFYLAVEAKDVKCNQEDFNRHNRLVYKKLDNDCLYYKVEDKQGNYYKVEASYEEMIQRYEAAGEFMKVRVQYDISKPYITDRIDEIINDIRKGITLLEPYYEETIRDTEEQYFPLLSEYNPQISKEKWFEVLTNEELIQKKWLVVLKCMLEMGGEATCKQMSKTYGKTSSFYNISARNIANVVIKETGCEQHIIDGKKKSWPVLFLGRNLKNSEDGVFSWKLRPELEEALKQMDLTEIEINADEGAEDRNMNKNIILYGPPGTGKTYNTVLYAVAICDGKSVGELEEKLNKDPGYYDVLLARYNELKNVEGRVAFITFHQSYGYEEFIEGIRPVISNEGDESDVSDVRYEFADGVFKGFCRKASEEVEENDIPYVFIIDEINRGNISKIFGELITLIETTKRIGSEEPTSTILPYTKEEFGVPNNVYILGTMNTADRSISLMDTALRRRFKFVEMMPKVSILTRLGITIIHGIDISEMLKTINDRIEYLFDREHTIGHAYFTSLAKDASIENLASIFQNAIIPLLQEYFYEDYSKIQLVLGDNGKQDDSLKFILDSKVNVKNIFKGDASDVEDLGEKKYEIQVKAFYNAESYKQIY